MSLLRGTCRKILHTYMYISSSDLHVYLVTARTCISRSIMYMYNNSSCFIGSRPRPRAIFPVMHSHGTLTTCSIYTCMYILYNNSSVFVFVFVCIVYEADNTHFQLLSHLEHLYFTGPTVHRNPTSTHQSHYRI